MATETLPAGRGSRWSRDLPPLFMVTALIAVIMLVLPNALNVPQQDPSPVLEYAPVPPSDEEPPNPPNGNTSSLSLGSSNTLGDKQNIKPPPPPGEGDKPSAKRCVGKPLRQTEDPMAPPCSAFFKGDNFGATWQGVTKDEIKILVYYDTGNYADEPAPDAGVYDLDKVPHEPCPKQVDGDPKTCSHIMMRVARSLANYFNKRFQTYDRRAHVYVHFTDNGSAEGRRADAAMHFSQIKPFAVLDHAVFDGFNEEYVNAAASRGILVFSSQISAYSNSFYRKNAPRAWGFWPDVEHWADSYSTYVCTKVAPYPVAHSGGPEGVGSMNGQERKYGFFYTTDPNEPGLELFYRLVKAKLEKCGVTAAAEGTFPRSRFIVDNSDTGTDQANAVARFRDAGVTTVLYLGGLEGKFTHLADQAKYYPEIVVAGDLYNDNYANARLQNQNVWKNAWAVSYSLREDRLEERFGFQAAKEADPNLDEDAASFAAEFYRDYFMLFQGIQVAGPRLTPERIDKGFHAIPPKKSDNPFVAACFFDPGDYTCVKDAHEAWWDLNGRRPGSNQPGCWRMVRGGKRYLAGTWEGGDDVFRNADDPCNGRGGTYRLRPAPA